MNDYDKLINLALETGVKPGEHYIYSREQTCPNCNHNHSASKCPNCGKRILTTKKGK